MTLGVDHPVECRDGGPAQRRKLTLRAERLPARSLAVTVIRCRLLRSREALINTLNVFLVVLSRSPPSSESRAERSGETSLIRTWTRKSRLLQLPR